MTVMDALYLSYINGEIAQDKEKQDKLAEMLTQISKASENGEYIEDQLADFLCEGLQTGFIAGVRVMKEIFCENCSNSGTAS